MILVSPKQDFNCDSANLKETMNSLGYEPTVSFDDLSEQQKEHVKVVTIYHTGRGFETKAYFDVADTSVIPGMKDIWSDEVGFDNNFTGHLNQKAIDDIVSKGVDYEGVDASEIYNKKEGNPSFLNNAIVKGITNKYPELTPVTNNNSLIAFEENVALLANYLLETKSKLVKQENRDLSVKIITAFVLCFTKLQPTRTLENLKNDILSRDAYLELRDRINDIMRLLNNSMIRKENIIMNMNESLPYLQSVDQMLNLMGIDPKTIKTKEETNVTMENKEDKLTSLKENFIKTLNKLNEHKYFNDKYEK